MFSQARRFIAGAVCPQCQREDRVVVYRVNDRDCRECVACGWQERWIESGASRPRGGPDAAAAPVRLIAPPDVAKSG